MKKLFYAFVCLIATSFTSAYAQDKPMLSVTSDGINTAGFIGSEYAFCAAANPGHVKEGEDKSIGLSWSAGPAGTKSYAIIAVDTDVPTVFDDAGKEGKTVSASLHRRDFYHWVLLDIPASKHMIPAYTDSQMVVKNGKSVLSTPYGFRGTNDYAGYFASNPERKGIYAGYDGPCPPWNDELVHHYHFKVFALDVETLGITTAVTGAQAMDALKKHILAQGEVIGKYTLNPTLKK